MSPATGAKIGRGWSKSVCASHHDGAVASAACANQRQFARRRSMTLRGRERSAACSSSASLRARTRAAPCSRISVTRATPWTLLSSRRGGRRHVVVQIGPPGRDVGMKAAYRAADSPSVGGAMSQYMLLVYEEEVAPAEQAEREHVTPALVELHASLREAGLLVGVQRLRSTESATSVRVRDGEAEITDGPFAVTKEVLAGYYVLECADLDEEPRHAARLPMAPWATIEVRPIMAAEEWLNVAREAGVELSDEDVRHLA